MKSILKTSLIINCLVLLSCSNEGDMNHDSIAIDKSEESKSEVSQEVLDGMMQSLPQPIEIAQIISSSKTEVGKNVLLPSENVNKMEDKYEQALSLGAYGVDLGYININDKTMYMLEYLECVKKLSAKLRVDQFFDFEMLSKLARNKKNTDSLVQISTENFNKIDQYLRDQNRGEQSILILIGAWMEGMNMFCEIYNDSKSDDLLKRIGEQKVVFDNVYLIVEKLDKIDFYKKLETAMAPLRSDYDKVKITYLYKKPVMKEVNGQLIQKDQTEMKIDCPPDVLNKVVNRLQYLRNQYFLIK
jgi:hypothetical protein